MRRNGRRSGEHSDPLGLGIDELSMNALAIPMVKKFIRSISMDECRELTWQAFQMQEPQEIHGFSSPGSWNVSPRLFRGPVLASIMTQNDSIKIICKNRKARFNFEIEDTFEAGISSTGFGSEISSERQSQPFRFLRQIPARRAFSGGCSHFSVRPGQPTEPRAAA